MTHHSLASIASDVRNGQSLSAAQIHTLITLDDERLPELLAHAHDIRMARFGNRVSLCAIVNAQSGHCSEDCSFCAQSAHHDTHCPEHALLSPEEIGEAARLAKEHGAQRFGVVASGKFVGHDLLEGFVRSVRAVAQQGLMPDLSPGILGRDQLLALKKAGLCGYHHNLETSASYFSKVCTTHTYEEDVQAVRTAMEAGLDVCCGGIFGIGESWDDRVELALQLRDLGIRSVPLNFLTPIPGTPLAGQAILSPEEALHIVALYRFLLPESALRICGGRQTVFGLDRKRELLKSGANGIMVGDYLTTSGPSVESDHVEITRAGLTFGKQQSEVLS